MKSQLESLVSKLQDGGIVYREAVRGFRKVFITAVLEQKQGNKVQAARALGMHRNTLHRAIVELGIAMKSAKRVVPQNSTGERRRA